MNDLKWSAFEPNKKKVIVKKDWEKMVSHMQLPPNPKPTSLPQNEKKTNYVDETKNMEGDFHKSGESAIASERVLKSTQEEATNTKERMSIPKLLNP